MPRARQGKSHFLPVKRRLRATMTDAERRLWSRLRFRQLDGLKFRRQHGIGPYIVDFYCPERFVVIEVDGDTHAVSAQRHKDHRRDAYLRSLGLRVVRYTNAEVIENLDGVLQDLTEKLLPPLPLLTKEGQYHSGRRETGGVNRREGPC